jgi:pyridoxal phosphate enzyme (YggS family)
VACVRERIEAAARRAGRDPREIALVAVSKRKPASAVVAALRAGVRHVGESYVQEAGAKIPEVARLLSGSSTPPPEWHLVGRLQRNKARDAARCFDWVQSVDRPELARELERRAAEAGRRLAVLLQVNTSGEPQKGGVAPEGLPGLLSACRELEHLELRGLMTVPEAGSAEAARPAFARLRELRERHGAGKLEHLSMGMSADFEVAIEEGATLVRLGSVIFGPREEPA